MIEYIEKFKKLPSEIRSKFSSVNIMQTINELEEKYGVRLATMIMRIMIGDVSFSNLSGVFARELNLDPARTKELEKELKERVFFSVQDYLESYSKKEEPSFSEEEKPFKTLPKGKIERLPKKVDLSHLLTAEKKESGEKDDISFLKEDEKEIREIEEATSEYKKTGVNEDKIRKDIEGIIKDANISFSSDDLAGRFKKIIATYLRGVRGKVDVKQAMARSFLKGGLGLEETQADKILLLAEGRRKENREEREKKMVNIKSTEGGSNFIFNENEIKEALTEREKAIKEKGGGLAARDADYDLASALKGRGQKIQKSEPEKKEEAPFPKPEKKSQDETDKFKKDSVLGQASEGLGEKREEKQKVRKSAVGTGKKKMDDIKVPKIMGPIDELAYMDLVTFRRLDIDVNKRIRKVGEKINLLAREGIDKMIEGKKAWRLNPINKIYLQIGEESISQGKTIDNVIEERKQKGLNYLGIDEFNAIMDLNRKLRF